MKKYLLYSLLLLLTSCSMTKNIPEDEQLFTGLTKIVYEDEQKDDPYRDHLMTTKAEVEAALATEPNGALFGSSYYTVPWSWHLWVYNKYSKKNSKFAKWMTKSFGKAPVLMSQVNPALRASVARSVLQSNGYFRGDVSYEIIPQKNPRKSKIGYSVRLDSLYTLDSIAYTNFPAPLQQLIDSTHEESLLQKEGAFSVSALDGERNRISTLFRNNGYYYYNSNYATYLADTFLVDNKAQLRFQLTNGIPDLALKKWYVGKINVQFRKTMREQLTDSIQRRYFSIYYNGKKSPIRPGLVMRNMRLRPRQLFSYENYMESVSKLNATGVFSTTDFQFTPRADTDTLDLRLNCVFNKPYDFYFEADAIGRTNGRIGPELKVGFSRLNLFRGAEKLDVNLHGSYEFQTGSHASGASYQYGIDASIEFPRIIAPFYNSDRVRRDKNGRRIRRRRFFSTPTTYAKVSADIVRRPDYYKMNIVTGEWTYKWQTSASSQHEFSPLTLKYQYKSSTTHGFDSIMNENPYLEKTMGDLFIPKMRYTYTYTSPASLRNPIRWETTIEEAGNLASLIDVIRGKSFSETGKKLFKNPYAQFIRIETDFTKNWSIGKASSLVGHINAGLLYSYGNSEESPFTEQFYAGGANSIRAFTARSIGPGAFSDYGLTDSYSRQLFYLLRNGDIKFVANLEYRTPLFGQLKGAAFLDVGNVWKMDQLYDDDEWFDAMVFKPSRLWKDMAVGTGVGLRYDLGFLVIRVDWGFALHLPCENGVSGYFFNAERFKDLHTLNFAIGYPF